MTAYETVVDKENDDLNPRRAASTVSSAWLCGLLTAALFAAALCCALQGKPFFVMAYTIMGCGKFAFCVYFWRDALRRADRIAEALRKLPFNEDGGE